MSGGDDFRAVATRLRQMAERSADPSPVLRVQAEDVRSFIDDRFASSTDPQGTAWAPFAQPPSAARGGSSAKLLVDTARLRQSIAVPVARNVMRVGTNVVYAGPQNARRRFLPFIASGASWALDRVGSAGALWDGVFSAVEEYIRTGRVT